MAQERNGIRQKLSFNDRKETMEDREEVDQMFYNQLTLEDIRENLQEFNCVIGEIKQILREVDDRNVD
jgi:hypothetical protein